MISARKGIEWILEKRRIESKWKANPVSIKACVFLLPMDQSPTFDCCFLFSFQVYSEALVTDFEFCPEAGWVTYFESDSAAWETCFECYWKLIGLIFWIHPVWVIGFVLVISSPHGEACLHLYCSDAEALSFSVIYFDFPWR